MTERVQGLLRLGGAAFIAAAVLLEVNCTKVTTRTGSSSLGNPWTIHGVLRVAAFDEPDNLNPMVGNQQAEVDLSMLWGAYLFHLNNHDEFVPELATRVPTLASGDISSDGLHITYHLRPSVTWQDGAPFSADDVIFSWHQVMNLANNVGSRAGYDDIKSIDKKGPLAIGVNLRRPYAPFISAFFSMGATPICIVPEHILSGYRDINHAPYNNRPIGTGPFIVQRYDHGSMIRFVANPHYFRGRPKLDAIEWRFIPNTNTMLTQLRTHEIDAVFAIPYEYYPQVLRLPNVHVYLTPETAYDQIALNLQNPQLADKTVRQALAYGIDRMTVVHNVYHNVTQLADSDQPSFLWAHNAHLRQYGFNPSLARRLLDGDGWKLGPDGFRYKDGKRLQVQFVTLPEGSGADNVIIQQSWQRIGVDTSIKIIAGPIFFASYGAGGTLQSGNFEAAYLGWYNGPDPDDSTQFMCDQFPPRGENLYRFCNHALDEQENIALTSYDPRVRKAAYDKIQQILAEEVPAIFVWYPRRVSVLNTDLVNFKPAHSASLLWNPWEWQI